MIDLLKIGRANGARRLLRGVTAFSAAYSDTPDGTRILTVETAGRDLSGSERGRLLNFASFYLGEIEAGR